MLSNFNIKYACTIYTRLDTCFMSISRFSLRDKVTLRLLKLHFYGADVVGWSRALDIRLRDWCCNLSMVWAQIPSKKEQNLLSNYNIKYACTIYKRLDTCIMSISRFSLREKVTLRLLKLHLYGVDMVEWCRALDIMLSDWCYSVSMVWVQIPSSEE